MIHMHSFSLHVKQRFYINIYNEFETHLGINILIIQINNTLEAVPWSRGSDTLCT